MDLTDPETGFLASSVCALQEVDSKRPCRQIHQLSKCEEPSEHQLHLHGVNFAAIDIEAVKGVRPELKALHRVPGLVVFSAHE